MSKPGDTPGDVDPVAGVVGVIIANEVTAWANHHGGHPVVQGPKVLDLVPTLQIQAKPVATATTLVFVEAGAEEVLKGGGPLATPALAAGGRHWTHVLKN